jgi:predicted NAD-dependent protein-ADP-ribosyltransferase YbiA (DUF1768 family)
MSILLSNPNIQPFGLLSNKANVNFISDGITWTSVSSYIYVNMFNNEHTKALMNEQLDSNPFATMQMLKNRDDTVYYEQEILNGLSIRFSQQPQLRARLYETRGKELVYDDPKILSLLNIIRNKNVIFDPLRGIEIPRIEVLSVIAGVEKKILENPYWPRSSGDTPVLLDDDNIKYENLIQYAIKNPPPDLPYNDEIFINVNNIVPILKFRLREKILTNDINKFKNHLLDVFLDYLLETEYPNVEKKDYKKAKYQQIVKEKNVDKYENQLYDLYLKNKIDILITSRLAFTPDKNLIETTNEKKYIDSLLKTPEIGNTVKVYIGAQDPFLPSFPEKVTINNKIFNTVVHYAYFKLLKRIELTPRKIDINEIPLNNLQEMYDYEKNIWMREKLKLNNEVATIAKFKQNEILFHLLQATLNSELIYNDKDDPILGINYDNRGENLSGRFLEYIRDYSNSLGINILNRKFSLKNVWYDNWLILKSKDYLNTIKLFKSIPTLNDLEIIYGLSVQPSEMSSAPSKREVQKMKIAGLTIEYINLVFPLVEVSKKWMQNMNERQVIEKWVKENEKMNKKPNLKLAKNKLKLIYNQINLNIKCNENTFIATILAGKPSDNLNEAKWQRIKYWMELN